MRITSEDVQRMKQEAVVAKEQKEEGLQDISTFLGKIKSKFDWADNKKILSSLESMSESDYTDLLTRLNKIISATPAQEAHFLGEKSSSKIGTGEMSIFDQDDIVFPEMENRKKLQHDFFLKLQETINEEKDSPTLQKRVAISIFNSLIYIHPFKDGNGRTARLSYFLLTPEIPNDKKDVSDVKKVLQSRGKSIERYHDQLNSLGYRMLCHDRGLGSDPKMKHRMDTSNWGFDATFLKFVAAYDAMTPEERTKYNKGTEEEYVFREKEFDVDLKIRYEKKLNEVRTEFTKKILDFSLDEKDGQVASTPWLQEEFLDKAFIEEKYENQL